MTNMALGKANSSKAPEKHKVAVLGCTGIVGQQFIRMLDGHPFFETAALCSSRKSAGKKYRDATDWAISGRLPAAVENMEITEPEPDALARHGVGIVFSALPSETALNLERRMVKDGFFVFSNAGAHRMNASTPIVIPEVNPEHMSLAGIQASRGGGFIVTNSNCTTAGLVMALKPLMPFGLQSITVTTYQALSGAGRNGIAALSIVDNVVPFIRNEEEKMERETKKILGSLERDRIREAPVEINASCCRVPTRDGHLESVVVELKDDAGCEDVSRAFHGFSGLPQQLDLPSAPHKPVIVSGREDRPQPLLDRDAGFPDRVKGMAVTVGRIRKKGEKINFFLLVHNTIRGAAGTCILNAEMAVKTNLIQQSL